MLAHVVAAPVLDRVAGQETRGVVRGVVRTAAYIELGAFVVALTARGVPLMPNGVAVTERPTADAWPAVGAPARLAPGRLEAGGRSVAWAADRPPVWDPTVRAADADAGALRRRAAAVLRARGIEATADATALASRLVAGGLETAAARAGRGGIALLLRSVAERDAQAAARAGDLLIGRGSGLTPEGDDLLAGAAVVVATQSPAVGWTAMERGAWLRAVRRPALRRLTTPLSATLLELATAGKVVEPVHGLLDLSDAGDRRWPGALHRLERIGHSTGPAYAAAVGAAALMLGD
jgi:hypothetical protein